MTEHLPECRQPKYLKDLSWGSISRDEPFVPCICDALRACEERVLKDTATRHLAIIKMIGLGILQTRADELRACEERIAGQLKEQSSEDSKWSYAKGFDDARWLAAKEALQAVQHEEPCDCEPCKAIARALAELWTIGQD